jgi:hypothetical protein
VASNKESKPKPSAKERKPRSSTKERKPESSVQNRLKVAAAKQTPRKLDLDATNNMILRALNIKMQKQQTEENLTDNFAKLNLESAKSSDAIVNNSKEVTDVKLSDLYTKSRELKVDHEGYCCVHVLAIDSNNGVYHVIMDSDFGNYNKYKATLNLTYNNSEIKRFEAKELIEKTPELLMANVENCWIRCKPIAVKTDGKMLITTVDYGVQKDLDIIKTEMKPVKHRESEVQGYCIKIKLPTVEKGELVEGDVIEIKVVDRSDDFVIIADVKLYDSSEDEKEESAAPRSSATAAVKVPERLVLKNIKLQKIGPGQVELRFISGNRLSEGVMHACESLSGFHAFFEQMREDIDEYAKANPSTGPYKPM